MRVIATRSQRGLVIAEVEIGLDTCKRINVETIGVKIVGNFAR